MSAASRSLLLLILILLLLFPTSIAPHKIRSTIMSMSRKKTPDDGASVWDSTANSKFFILRKSAKPIFVP